MTASYLSSPTKLPTAGFGAHDNMPSRHGVFLWLINENPGNRGNLRVIQALWYKTSSTDENF
jgi:hypothetical protein